MINFAVLGRATALAVLVAGSLSMPARAQDISEDHLNAARQGDRRHQRDQSLRQHPAGPRRAPQGPVHPGFSELPGRHRTGCRRGSAGACRPPRRSGTRSRDDLRQGLHPGRTAGDLRLLRHRTRQEASLDRPAGRARVDEGCGNLGERHLARSDQPDRGKAAHDHRCQSDRSADRRDRGAGRSRTGTAITARQFAFQQARSNPGFCFFSSLLIWRRPIVPIRSLP